MLTNEIMRANLRSFDPVVRYGGDEFVRGMGGVDITDVEHRFEVIDTTLRDDLGVGISVGVAALEAKESLDDLTARADAKLLATKRARRRSGGRDGENPPGPVAD